MIRGVKALAASLLVLVIGAASCTRTRAAPSRVVHLNLGDIAGPTARAGALYLHAPRGKHQLVAHDEASRERIPEAHPLRLEGRDDEATHYATGVDIPTDRVGVSTVTFEPDGGGPPELLALTFHPFSAFDLHNGATAAMLSAADGGLDDGSGLLRCSPDQPTGSALDTAASLVFLHPEITSLDATEASRIACHIYQSNPVLDLALAVKSQGRATTTGGFATLVPVLDADGGARVDAAGKPLFDVQLSLLTREALRPALRDVLAAVKRDATLPYKQYATVPGRSEIVVPLPSLEATSSSGYDLVPEIAKGSHTHGVTWRELSVHEGPPRTVSVRLHNVHLRWFGLYVEAFDADGKAIALKDLGSYCDYAADHSLAFTCVPWLDGDTKRFVGILAAPPTVMGVPLPLAVFDTELELPIPDQAVSLRLALGSIGMGSWEEGRVLVPGVTLTSIVQIALPLYTIIHAYGLEESETLWKGYLMTPGIIDLVQAAKASFPLFESLYTLPTTGKAADWSDADKKKLATLGVGAVIHVADGATRFLLDTALAKWIAKDAAEAETEQKIPIVGVALQVASVAAAIDDLGATTTQVFTNPAVFDNRFTLEYELAATVHHDLDDFQFPATAVTWEVEALPAGKGATALTTGPIALPATTVSDALTASIRGLPSGSTVRVRVTFRDEAGRVVGDGYAARYAITADALETVRKDHADAADLDAVMTSLRTLVGKSYPDTPALVADLERVLGADVADLYRKSVARACADLDLPAVLASGEKRLPVECTIREAPPVLTADTRYVHRQALELDAAGHRVWKAGPAPTVTWGATSCAGSAGALCAMASPTLLQRTGQLGYTWRSASTGLVDCRSGMGKTQLWSGQAVALTQQPQSGLEPLALGVAPCGLPQPALVAFDLLGPHSGRGLNVAVVPDRDGDGRAVFRVKRVVVDGKQPLAAYGPTASGRLGLAPTAIAVHPSGRVVSVCQSLDKLEVVQLSPTPVDANDAPQGTVYGGAGDLPGLLGGPVAVAIGPRGLVYVLESGNRRVQAFDVYGQPVAVFAGGTQPFFSLDAASAGNLLLDLGVEPGGHVYVLSAADAGTAPVDYWLDVYDPDGALLARTDGVAAGRMLVDLWRNVYTLDFATLQRPDGMLEPAVSLWIPETPP